MVDEVHEFVDVSDWDGGIGFRFMDRVGLRGDAGLEGQFLVADDLGEEHVDRGGHVDAHPVEGFCGTFLKLAVGAYLDSCIQLHHFSVCELFVLLLSHLGVVGARSGWLIMSGAGTWALASM